MPLITADYIFSPDGWLTDTCLEIDESGKILQISPLPAVFSGQTYKGILIPGLINAHCHLELSMLAGEIPRLTGMTGFILEVIGKRNHFPEAVQRQAAVEAMEELWESGTVAVGDICNTGTTIEAKQNSPLFTYSFIELLGLGDGRAEGILAQGLELQEAFGNLPNDLSPHAPYSMSSKLIQEIYAQKPALISVHLLESREETQLFHKKKGPFYDFYRRMNIPFEGFEAENPIEHVLKDADSGQPMILVHNTEMSEQEIESVARQFPEAYFCLCPRSNAYIHGTFPDFRRFLNHQDRICLGTDSLASNDSLNIFDELVILQQEQPEIPLHSLIIWATWNGARALGQSDKFGIFAPGYSPGINLISNIAQEAVRLTGDSQLIKLY